MAGHPDRTIKVEATLNWSRFSSLNLTEQPLSLDLEELLLAAELLPRGFWIESYRLRTRSAKAISETS